MDPQLSASSAIWQVFTQGQDYHPSSPAAPLDVHSTALAIASLGCNISKLFVGFFGAECFPVSLKKSWCTLSLCAGPCLSSSRPLCLSPAMPPGAWWAEPGSLHMDLEVIFLEKWGKMWSVARKILRIRRCLPSRGCQTCAELRQCHTYLESWALLVEDVLCLFLGYFRSVHESILKGNIACVLTYKTTSYIETGSEWQEVVQLLAEARWPLTQALLHPTAASRTRTQRNTGPEERQYRGPGGGAREKKLAL